MSAHLPRLVVASSNPGKLTELGALLAGLAAEIVPQSALGISPAAETALTFADNALLKARHAARFSGSAALADDSGLEVDALGGEPGVHSARYAGQGASALANNTKLLEALAATPEPRRARYRCVIALVMGADDPAPLLAAGSWEGRIAFAPRGTGGFGYDPLFLVGEGALTAAELPPEVKNRISHRALALRALTTGLGRT
ncbi:MAG TPA: RdgB/HAM1 family non-canonical purine NTP pyrophosphatase [Steroidobacteraceae bacterium]|nr:RdgB/HAM1 family non-canonical purine NTP pyrophosphatase [Steroidobacteraceae bacterium]